MVITVPDGFAIGDIQDADHLGVQLSFDETSYRLMMEALDRTIKGKGRLGYLRDLFYTHQQPETFVFPPMHFPYLNKTQEDYKEMQRKLGLELTDDESKLFVVLVCKHVTFVVQSLSHV